MNAKFGKEIWTGIAVDTCGLHYDSNNNRTRLINYAVHQPMVIGSNHSHTETYIEEVGTVSSSKSFQSIYSLN